MWGIDAGVLPRMLLPVGHQTKAETRAVARKIGLNTADKVESQDICFVPDGDHTKIIRKKLGDSAPALSRGPFVLSSGEVIGEHEGYARFTIGQRRGVPGGFPEAMYVVAIRPESRTVVVGPKAELLGRGLTVREVNWLVSADKQCRDRRPQTADRSLALGVDNGRDSIFSVQIRHHAAPSAAEIIRDQDGEIELALDEPVSAITPGQSAVFYDGDRVLGGGVIEAARGAVVRAPLPILAA
jgi:tRNA-specific 2-thiouridylase